MATFTKRERGWRAQVRKMGVSRSATFQTKAHAQAWARNIEIEIEKGLFNSIPNVAFSQLIEKYLKEITPNKLSAKQERLRLLRLQSMPIGNISLRELNDDHFRTWRDTRLKEVSSESVRREWSTINHMLNLAVNEWKLLQQNPLKAVKKPEPHRPRTRRYSQDEIDKIIHASGFSFDYFPETRTARVGAAFLFAIETAMRAGEIVNLNWEYINFNNRIAHLPKTKNGWPRDVPLTKKAMEIIELLFKGKNGDSVFQLSSASLEALFQKLKKRTMLDDIHFHDTRREALTRLAQKVDVMILAKISGHRDLSILQNTYYAPDMKDVVKSID